MQDSPRIKRKCRQPQILKMNLPRNIIQRSLRSAISRVRKIALFHIRQTRRRSPQSDKFWRFGTIQKGQDGLEEVDDAVDVDFEMLADVGDFDFADGGEDFGDAGVGDDDVEGCDVVR